MTGQILMVDDEPDAQDLIQQNFRREIRKGVYSFGFAGSGESALDAISHSKEEVMLVLSDINMPGMSGIELLQELRARWPELPVMMITAYVDAATEAKVRELGAEQFLTKPVDFVELKERLSQFVGDTT
ncbi:response regulator [Ruegeria conchae]|uniref:Response regulator receiver domain-containing protein n=1 Tax=Ruegeria conchae TaxID=981384 RepID=A0A497ZNF1_9RHOB|nr:response regulator [Ruegeria conchae]RLK08215.1 response regulator receiver domain-containing protein [Ruegeria conchae]